MFGRKETNKSGGQATASAAHSKNETTAQSHAPSGKTRIIIKYDAGFPNQLFIRGSGAGLSWEKGVPLKNVNANEWMWETEATFNQCEYKVLINDQVYECGENHQSKRGAVSSYTPHFP